MEITKKRLMKWSLLILTVVLVNVGITYSMRIDMPSIMQVKMGVSDSLSDTYQFFYGLTSEWSEESSAKVTYETNGQLQDLIVEIPKESSYLRVDLGTQEQTITLSGLELVYLGRRVRVDLKQELEKGPKNQIKGFESIGEMIEITTEGADPYVVIEIDRVINELTAWTNSIRSLCLVGILLITNIFLLLLYKKRRIILVFIYDIIKERQLIYRLAKNDFKTKYAGSYLGITWAFIQPIISILVYWFVFQVGFKSAPIQDFPFVLWLVGGLVPWFFFSEAWMSATSSLMEYSYLVKKVVFKINILPIVKIVSAFFVHLFFLGFVILLFIAYGYYPNLYNIQLLYYMICMFVLILAVSYVTSAMVLFFKDLGQIINIILQVGMWMTPIMWSYDMISPQYQWILKLNPMYYVVQGYRDSLINKVGFWEYPIHTLYFWLLVISLFIAGIIIFKRLKPHFADVL